MSKPKENAVASSSDSSCLVCDLCCLCIPVETGSFIIAYLNLVGLMIMSIVAFLGFGAGVALESQDDPKMQELAPAVLGVSLIVLIFILIGLVFSVLLLIGLHQGKRSYIKVYLIFSVVGLTLSFLIEIVKYFCGMQELSAIISVTIQNLISIYFLLVLRSQYVKMESLTINTV